MGYTVHIPSLCRKYISPPTIRLFVRLTCEYLHKSGIRFSPRYYRHVPLETRSRVRAILRGDVLLQLLFY